MIELEQVTKRYADGTVAVEALSLEMPTGTITCLVGSSGCGKTTTLRMVNRMVEPTSGRVLVDGVDVRTLSPHELRRRIGYVIQHAGLFPHRSVLDNVTTVPRLLGWSRARATDRARELLELVGLDPALAGRYPAQLSGGQQQRVGVARALAADPPVLLMDEPFGAVDPVQRAQLQAEFARLQRELRKTVVFVTHDVHEAVRLGDRVAVLGVGARVHQHCTPSELLAAPADEMVAEFLGTDRRITLLGLVDAGQVPVRALDDPCSEWDLAVDGSGQPTAWRSRAGAAGSWALVPVGPAGTARDLLDAALSSPARAAVRVDEQGRAIGRVHLDDVALLAETWAARA